MSLQSTNMLPDLLKIPGGPNGIHQSSGQHLTALLNTDRTFYAAEYAAGISSGLWLIFDSINVNDNIHAAYEAQYPNLAADHSLYDHVQEMMSREGEAIQGFISGLKGKMAEFNAAQQLESAGYADVSIAADPTQAVFDITATTPDGAVTFWQVKTGTADYADQVQDAMAESPDVSFAVSSEIYEAIAETPQEAAAAVLDIGQDWALVAGIQDGLETLSDNLGIDIPDGIGEIIPHVAAIAAGVRLIVSVISTERQFKAADRTTKNKIQVVQTLTLMSRMGVTAVLSAAGGTGGAAAGSLIPGVGNAIGGIVGIVGGGVTAMFLNRHLQPRMLSLALDITGLEEDDLFYYKNKLRIDQLALSFQRTASRSTAA